MKVYALRPMVGSFDGSGALSEASGKAIDLIADITVEAMRAGGDVSHQAVFWEGVSNVGDPPTCLPLSDPAQFKALAFRMLDPNDPIGGDIRSGMNCRAVTFGQDGQALVCLRHVDTLPVVPTGDLITVTEISQWLISTDLLDGTWPDQ